MSERMKEIMQMIADPKIKCVSFDMFDTLVQRPVINPEDVFTLIGKVLDIDFFKHRRIQASKRAYLFKDYYKACVNIDDIYAHYQIMFNTSNKETDLIKQKEHDVEFDLLYARKSVKKLYDFAKKKGKKILIISDMYFSALFLQKVLKHCGITEYYKIYVSCEYNATKSDGALYDVVLRDMEDIGIYSDNILHFGDNKRTDIENANTRGINAVFIPSAKEIFVSNNSLKKFQSWNMPVYETNNNIMLGLLANMYFDDPFVEYKKNSYFNGNAKNLGYLVAPFLFAFCAWLAKESEKNDVGTLLLAWRDGFLIEKIFSEIKDILPYRLPDLVHFHMGRILRYPTFSLVKGGLFDECYRLFVGDTTTVKQFIVQRLLLTEKEDIDAALDIFAKYGYTSESQEMGKIDKYIWFLHEFESYYAKGASKQIALTGEYIDSLFKNQSNHNNVAVFDVGYRASIAKFLEDFYNISIDTYHIAGTPGSYEKHDDRGIFAFVDYGRSTILRTASYLHMFFEILICEQIPSAIAFEKKDNKVDVIYDDIDFYDDNINKIQDAIMEFVITSKELLANYIHFLNFDKHLFLSIITEILISPTEIDAELIRTFKLAGNVLADEQTTFETWYKSKMKKG
jgi:FMN phosphatase YigB (HAD superfamily)